ncbi:MAG: ribonuclease HII [Desulfovibrio sp.]|nr:ribonuclease HII [Desulfovibrio sp.]
MLPFAEGAEGFVDSRIRAGIDEAGRGCLAGPVVACAVILPASYDLPGLTDSKACTARLRETLAPCIKACAVSWGLGVIWPGRIDSINILQATFEAMSLAVRHLRTPPGLLLVDGDKTVPEAVLAHLWSQNRPEALPPQRAIINGDAIEPAISAASILAKTIRDRLMLSLGKRWPGYGFAVHKGYGTKDHYEALRRLGPCPQHRLTFSGVCEKKPTAAQQGSLL